MTLDDMKTEALRRIQDDNPDCKDFKIGKTYRNIMNGSVITVSFQNTDGKADTNHVYFGREEARSYRRHPDILQDVSVSRERVLFFRFIELVGVGGLIASFLVVILSVLLFFLALENPKENSIIEVVKLSFTTILGFFFGSQAASQKTFS